MPNFFAQRHDSFLEAFLTTNTMRFIDKDRQVLAKNKQNYVIEVWASIKPMQNNQQQLQFVGQLKLDKPFQAVCFIMTYNDCTIDNISSTCISVMKFDSKMVAKDPKWETWFPGLYEKIEAAQHKDGIIYDYKYPEDSEFVSEGEKGKTIKLLVKCREIWVTGLDKCGYQWTMNEIEKKEETKKKKRKHKPCSFQFRYDKQKGILVGEFTENMVDDLLSDGEFQPDNSLPFDSGFGSNIDGMTEFQKNPEDNNNEIDMKDIFDSKDNAYKQNDEKGLKVNDQDNINYGADIKILRLFDGRPQEIIMDESESSEDEEDAEERMRKFNAGEDINYDETGEAEFDPAQFKKSIKDQKHIIQIMSHKKTPWVVNKLNIMGHLFFIIIIGLAVMDYIMVNNKFDSIHKNIDYIRLSYLQVAEVHNIIAKTRD